MVAARGELTQALERLRAGEAPALDQIVVLLYDELRAAARGQRSRLPSAGLDTTALVHETYLRLSEASVVRAGDREHFLALASRAMRQVLIDEIRRRSRQRRGSGAAPLTLGAADLLPTPSLEPERLLDLDRALLELEASEPRLVRVLECRVFGGMSEEEIGRALDCSWRTVHRDWVKAKGWLALRLGAVAS